ncbi:hepatic lectin-like [Rhinoderma darwinii]|uniref:hepatic lectin-like n=1 Tax=Rhinoderma darwinii TaxID=43563 RepID=UPI003F67C4AD
MLTLSTAKSVYNGARTLELDHGAMEEERGTCDTVWQLFEGNCYFFSNSKSNWHKARTMCLYKSADLLVIDNENEQKFISGKTGNTPYWIGLNDIEEEGNWTWVDGTDYKSSYKSWMPNEPKNTFRSEDSAQVLMGGNWDDKYCSDSSYAICEKKV